jgi:carbamoyl-phosphate synthase small subunit
MTGYEIFTDPSYFGQIMVAPMHIGNYGVNAEEIESDKITVQDGL